MKRLFRFLLVVLIVGCASHDPILEGTRIDVFDNTRVNVTNQEIPKLSESAKNISGAENCNYRQDESNNIWNGDKKIFSGFATGNVVKSEQSPVCEKGFIYTGLTTGEVIKINVTNKNVIWVADVFRASNLTGGASVVDVVAHVGLDKDFVYAGGLGDAFCKLNKYSGDKIWCLNISVPVDFVLVDNFAFVVGADNYLYAINTKNGTVYWKTEIDEQVKPIYENNLITIGDKRINSFDGAVVKTGWF